MGVSSEIIDGQFTEKADGQVKDGVNPNAQG